MSSSSASTASHCWLPSGSLAPHKTTQALSRAFFVAVDFLSKAESNLVHRTGDETIGGNKTFTGVIQVPADFSIVEGADHSPDIDCKLASYNLGDVVEDTSQIRSWHALYSADNKEKGRFAVLLENSNLARAEIKCSRPLADGTHA